MQSRRDMAHAQKYLGSRLSSALLSGDPDAQEPPSRRDTRGLVGGFAIAGLLVVGIGAFALLFPSGSTAWQQPNTLIVDEAGSGRYFLVDGLLRPVLNMASARLIAGANLKVVAVSAKTLAGTPRGAPLGIAGAPDGLPTAGLPPGVWRDCATTPNDPLPASGSVRDVVEIASADAGTPAEPLLVRAGATRYVVIGGKAHRVAADFVADALGLGQVPPVDVSEQWLALLPRGGDLAPLDVPHAGQPGPEIDGKAPRIGQLFDTATSHDSTGHFQLRADGLLMLSPLQFLLASAQQGGQRAVLSAYALAHASRAVAPAGAADMPAEVPAVGQPQAGQVPCVQTRPAREAADPQVVLAPLATGAHPAPPAGNTDATPTTAVLVPPARGAVVATRLPDYTTFSNVYLVSDDGSASPIADSNALSALGYSLDQVVLVTPQWLSLLPPGPELAKPAIPVPTGRSSSGT